MNFGEFFNTANGWQLRAYERRLRSVTWALPSLNEPLVFIVRANPKPLGFFTSHNRQGAMVAANPDRPERTDLLEMQRRVLWIPEPEFEVLSRQTANVGGQPTESLTETSFRRGNHPVPPQAGRGFPPVTDRGGLAAFHCERPPRSGGPTHPRAARADAARAGKSPFSATLQWPVRFPGCSSRIYYCFKRAAVSSRFNARFSKGPRRRKTKGIICGCSLVTFWHPPGLIATRGLIGRRNCEGCG